LHLAIGWLRRTGERTQRAFEEVISLTCAILGTIFHKQQITSRKLKDHIPASSNTMVAFVGSILKGENGFMRLELCYACLTEQWISALNFSQQWEDNDCGT
jgi:hypothetical protein